jgi:hypothetical protein
MALTKRDERRGSRWHRDRLAEYRRLRKREKAAAFARAIEDEYDAVYGWADRDGRCE